MDQRLHAPRTVRATFALERTASGLACLVVLASVGCGGMPSSISGQVSIDGEPVEAVGDIRGQVVFQSSEEGAAPASGVLDESGRYVAKTGDKRGLSPGEYKVVVNVVRTIPPRSEGAMPWAERLTPARYTSANTSGLTVNVERGSNTFDIDIQSNEQ